MQIKNKQVVKVIKMNAKQGLTLCSGCSKQHRKPVHYMSVKTQGGEWWSYCDRSWAQLNKTAQ